VGVVPGHQRLFDHSSGERTVPGIWHENYWFRRHEVAYRHVAPWFRNGVVLEAGSGEGYGGAILASGGAAVLGLDYDPAAARHAARAYPSIPVLRANLVALPLASRSVDAFVSMQTVEHLWDQHAFLAEAVRITRPGGVIVLSTPNRLTFPPGNPHHPHELSPSELVSLASEHAEVSRMLGVRHGRTLLAWEAEYGSLVDEQLRSAVTEWPDHVRAMVTEISVDDFFITSDDIDTSLDLLLVAEAPRS
jgi:SAM-dependent methyltransferase